MVPRGQPLRGVDQKKGNPNDKSKRPFCGTMTPRTSIDFCVVRRGWVTRETKLENFVKTETFLFFRR